MALADAVSSAVVHYKLDETTDDVDRVDSIGSNDLTSNNTVGNTTGLFGSCADFTSASSQFLRSGDTADLSTGDIDFMWRLYVQLKSKSASQMILTKWTSTDKDYLLYYNQTADRFQWHVYNATDGEVSVVANNLGSPSTSTWYLIHVWHDSASNEIGIAVNNGTADTASVANGVSDTAANFVLGRHEDGGVLYLDGLIDDVVLLKNYILDSTERGQDYNSGSFRNFDDWSSVTGGSTTIPAVEPGVFNMFSTLSGGIG